MFSNITDMFKWLQSSGVLIIGITFLGSMYKIVYPATRSRIKSRQLQQLGDAGLSIVTKLATFQALSNTDRFNAASKELQQFATEFHIDWVTPEVANTIVEDAYQAFKLSGKDNHSPIETTVSEEDLNKVLGEGQEQPAYTGDQKQGDPNKTGDVSDGQ